MQTLFSYLLDIIVLAAGQSDITVQHGHVMILEESAPKKNVHNLKWHL